MADFTSALFLGWRHPSAELKRWTALTTGRPAALAEPRRSAMVAERIAAAQAAPAGLVHRSTLHALVDVLSYCARPGCVMMVDAGTYPLVRAAVSAVAREMPVVGFAHHDVEAAASTPGRPIVVTDGWCTGCNRPAPLPELDRLASARGGVLIVDDTQGIGVLGAGRQWQPPFGLGGGGTMRWLGAVPITAVQVVSLAKAYGAPLAVTTGPAPLVAQLRQHGTRRHSSPPSAADATAADRATIDDAGNDWRRDRTAQLVRRLRSGLCQLGLPAIGQPFPLVQVRAPAATSLYQRLGAAGVSALLLRDGCGRRPSAPRLAFAVTACHREADIDSALDVLARSAAAS